MMTAATSPPVPPRTSVLRGLIADLRPFRRPAHVLYWTAAFWAVSAVVHPVPLAMDAWDLSGAVSFRKPLVFSASIALTLATAGWILDRLPDRPRLAGTLAWTLAVASTIEVALIVVQTWRGQPSHFNVFERGDELVFITMAVAVAIMSVCLVGLLVWACIQRPTDPLVRTAVIAGLVLVATGLGLGQWIIELGVRYVETYAAVPDTVLAGERGMAKFPHAIALHGVQVFIGSALGLRHGGIPAVTARRLMLTIVGCYTGMLIAASAQTVAGLGPAELTVWSTALVLLGAGLAGALVRVAVGLRDHPSESEPVDA